MEPQGPRFVTALVQLANRIDLYNFGRWIVLALIIGVVAGLGAAVLTWGVDGVAGVLQHRVVGFEAPGHGVTDTGGWQPPKRPWLLLLVLPGAGLLVGWIVTTFAPEAEGHGTDAVINAYHRKLPRRNSSLFMSDRAAPPVARVRWPRSVPGLPRIWRSCSVCRPLIAGFS